MRILHLPSTYFPAYTGGKEVFVHHLITNIPSAEHRVVVHEQDGYRQYTHNGVDVSVLPLPLAKDKRHAYFTNTYDALPGFSEILDEYKPDLVHFHDFCAGASLSHLRICNQKGIKTLLTYHSPGSSCMQRGLTYAGIRPCDGRIDMQRCTACRYQSAGFPTGLARVASQIRSGADKGGRVILRNSTELFYNSWREFYDTVSKVHVYALWLKDMLVRNHISSEKIHFIDMGGHAALERNELPEKKMNQPLKIVFSGRCTNIKGAHILVEAIKLLPSDIPLEVHFFGPYWDDTAYGKSVQEMVHGDARFKAPRMIAPAEIVEELKQMDICVIPSLWPETGPLSLFDAFAAGLPVIGTRLAGIAERVKDGENGLLFEWGNSRDLANKLKQVLTDRPFLEKLRISIRDNKTFEEAAREIEQLYSSIVGKYEN